MNIQHRAGAAFRALTAKKDGPSIYEICDPVLMDRNANSGHLSQFYKTALRNPALVPLLRRAGLPELRDPGRMQALRAALAAGGVAVAAPNLQR